MKLRTQLAGISCAVICSIAGAQAPIAPAPDEIGVPQASISLSPAVIMVRGRPGQSMTQNLTIVNHTTNEIRFTLATEDVLVSNGKRSYVPAGQMANGIAASAVATLATIVLKPNEEGSDQVTFTIPIDSGQRAVVALFHGVASTASGDVGLGSSLGTLVTFNESSNYEVEVGPLQVSTQTNASNVILSEELRNGGSEPVMPKGVVVILNASGKRVGKAAFTLQRLLPGERLIFAATNPAQLAPGDYRTLSSFEFEGKVITSAGQFTISE